MKTERFVCSALGIDGNVIDRLCDDFDLDFDDNDVVDVVKSGINEKWGPGICLLHTLYDQIVAKYPDLNEEDFDYDFDSPSFPVFYYKKKPFKTKDELEKLIKTKK